MSSIKALLRRVPGVSRLSWMTYLARLKLSSREKVFSEIHRKNGWAGRESLSGTGSDLTETGELIRLLPIMLKELRIQSILDLPCGDFNWMQHLDLGSIQYTGGDIVPELIERNKQKYGRDGRHFVQLDLAVDRLPSVQLILCRDCLVHLSFADISRALQNIARSDAQYLLTTHYPDRHPNEEIITGQWRTLNLTAAPFHLPLPREMIDEKCPQDGGAYADKMLALWAVEDIRKALQGPT